MILGKAISPFALRKKSSGGGGTDADAQLFITATGISGTNATATNQLVLDLKAANIWTKMKAIYPMVGGTSTTCKFNLKDPRNLDAAYRLVFNGGGTFSANGYQPNGTNAYADTRLNTSTNLSSTNSHLSYYSRTDLNTTQVEIGNGGSASGPYYMLEIRTTGTTYFIINQNITFTTASDANSLGFYIGTRTGTVVNGFKNGTKIATLPSSTATTRPNFNIYIGAANYANTATFYLAKQCAFASIGDDLTDAEALAFYNAVQLFNTTLGRQV